MTDSELLELTAKAAGCEVLEVFDGGNLHIKGSGVHKIGWNPLTDDGDALRLAVRLRIHIEQNKDALYGEFTQCAAIGIHWNDRPVEWWDKNESPEAATRRAIVRAAAEIGRNMP